jgi:FtsP/CotA-like multicopper oxidase with cupredoxin domain
MEAAFDVVDRAGPYWYHPHPHGPDGGRVGFQCYAGLAGPLIIEDEAERALGLPEGEQELVLGLAVLAVRGMRRRTGHRAGTAITEHNV